MRMQTVRYKAFNPELPVIAPKRGTASAAGYDLTYVGYPVILEPGKRYAFPTNLILEIPESFYGRIAPRSGLAFKQGIDVLAGVIDSDYRGEVKVILVNLGDKSASFLNGDKIAQIIFERYYDFVVEPADQLEESERGEGGFGSTDKKSKVELLCKICGGSWDKAHSDTVGCPVKNEEVVCATCGAPPAFPTAVKTPYYCSSCQGMA
jgi:dUTP pyrophosphatase